MKKNQKIFLSFFFLLFFHETYQFNLKTSIAKYTLNHSIITEALIEKNSKKFIIKIIGKEKWDEMTKSLDSLGSKWKNKILSVVSFFSFVILFFFFIFLSYDLPSSLHVTPLTFMFSF